MKTNRYIDALESCNQCGKEFVIRVYDNGSYDYITETCECESDFSPVNGELSISQAIETLKPLTR